MAGELRYSEELPEGVRRIDPRQWRFLLRRLEAVRQVFPSAALVGGTALRLWCSRRNMDVPEETPHPDIDILNPGTRFLRTKKGPATGAVEVYPAFSRTFEEPAFTTIDHEGRPLAIISPAHLAVNYAGLIYEFSRRGIDYRKYSAYYQIARDTLLPDELPTYASRFPTHYGFWISELMEMADEITSEAGV
ncbi:MAG TPA: hypothetical protein VFK97_03270 [Candidatus Saccharimonadales bacterium]|nr:hypothetical protein [Candidatus Saccharimonadales bacterium]